MSNCLIFALARWWTRGGYLIVRRSKWGFFPHFLWAEDLHSLPVEQYVPRRPKTRLLPPPLFRGHVKRGPDSVRSRLGESSGRRREPRTAKVDSQATV